MVWDQKSTTAAFQTRCAQADRVSIDHDADADFYAMVSKSVVLS